MTDISEHLFVVIATYIVPLEVFRANLEPHLAYLDEQYQKGVFISSGPLEPYTGGMIIARCESREALDVIIKQDPNYQKGFYKYEIYEFKPRFFKY